MNCDGSRAMRGTVPTRPIDQPTRLIEFPRQSRDQALEETPQQWAYEMARLSETVAPAPLAGELRSWTCKGGREAEDHGLLLPTRYTIFIERSQRFLREQHANTGKDRHTEEGSSLFSRTLLEGGSEPL